MSERQIISLNLATGIAAFWIVVCMASGLYMGRMWGRAEQKKWDAENPAVKEVQLISSTLVVAKDESYYLGECKPYDSPTEFPIVSCAVMKFKIGTAPVVDTGIRLLFSIRKDGKWVLAPPPPKPEKGSKRRESRCRELLGIGFICDFDSYPAQPILAPSGSLLYPKLQEPVCIAGSSDGYPIEVPCPPQMKMYPDKIHVDMLCENSRWDEKLGACVPAEPK